MGHEDNKVEIKRFPVINKGISAVRHSFGRSSVDAIVSDLSPDKIIDLVVDYYGWRKDKYGINGGGTEAGNGKNGGYISSEQGLREILREGLKETHESSVGRAIAGLLTQGWSLPPIPTTVNFDYDCPKQFRVSIGRGVYIDTSDRRVQIFAHPKKDGQLLVTYSFGTKYGSRMPLPDETKFLNSLRGE